MTKLQPHDPISDLAASPLLDELDGPTLLVYLRILGRASQLVGWMPLTNSELHHHGPTARRALGELERRKLISIRRDTKFSGRELRILR